MRFVLHYAHNALLFNCFNAFVLVSYTLLYHMRKLFVCVCIFIVIRFDCIVYSIVVHLTT